MIAAAAGNRSSGTGAQKPQHAVFFTNLGMVGMNVGLDVRVIDQIGLANPLAQHTERLKHGRIGHDKNLFPDWVIADGPWVKVYPGIPGYLDAALGRPSGGGPAMPRDQGGAELGACADDAASVRVQLRELLRIHRLPDRPCSALRARQVRAPDPRRGPARPSRVSAPGTISADPDSRGRCARRSDNLTATSHSSLTSRQRRRRHMRKRDSHGARSARKPLGNRSGSTFARSPR